MFLHNSVSNDYLFFNFIRRIKTLSLKFLLTTNRRLKNLHLNLVTCATRNRFHLIDRSPSPRYLIIIQLIQPARLLRLKGVAALISIFSPALALFKARRPRSSWPAWPARARPPKQIDVVFFRDFFLLLSGRKIVRLTFIPRRGFSNLNDARKYKDMDSASGCVFPPGPER